MPERAIYTDKIVTVKDRVAILDEIAQKHGGTVTNTGKLTYIDSSPEGATSAIVTLPRANKNPFWKEVIQTRKKGITNR